MFREMMLQILALQTTADRTLTDAGSVLQAYQESKGSQWTRELAKQRTCKQGAKRYINEEDGKDMIVRQEIIASGTPLHSAVVLNGYLYCRYGVNSKKLAWQRSTA